MLEYRRMEILDQLPPYRASVIFLDDVISMILVSAQNVTE